MFDSIDPAIAISALSLRADSANASPPAAQPAIALVSITAPDVFSFQDFRVYLTAWFQWKKRVQPHYSGALFAQKAGFNSHTLLGMVSRGQRNLSATSIRAFCRALGLKGKEAIYFEKLVLFNQATHADDQAYYFEQLLQVSRARAETVSNIREASAPDAPSVAWVIDEANLQKLMGRIEMFSQEVRTEFAVAQGKRGSHLVSLRTAVTPVESD